MAEQAAVQSDMFRQSKFQPGEQVIVYLPADTWKRHPPFGTVEAVTWHTDKTCTPPRVYAVYTVRMEDGEHPNPIDVTEYHIDRYVEMAVTAAQEAAGQ